MNFKKNDSGFVCQNCKSDVPPLKYSSRDHCTNCLCSLHVDVLPGDRANTCKGLLVPIDVQKSSKGFTIVYRCQKCGKIHKNIVARDDNFDTILSVMNKTYKVDDWQKWFWFCKEKFQITFLPLRKFAKSLIKKLFQKNQDKRQLNKQIKTIKKNVLSNYESVKIAKNWLFFVFLSFAVNIFCFFIGFVEWNVLFFCCFSCVWKHQNPICNKQNSKHSKKPIFHQPISNAEQNSKQYCDAWWSNALDIFCIEWINQSKHAIDDYGHAKDNHRNFNKQPARQNYDCPNANANNTFCQIFFENFKDSISNHQNTNNCQQPIEHCCSESAKQNTNCNI